MSRFLRGQLASAISVLALVPSSLTTSCGNAEPPAAPRREVGPQWQDIFDGTPDIYVVVRPQAIKRDAVYGALFKNVLRMAQARTPMRGVTTLEALDGCEEIVVGIRKDGDGRGEDAAMIFRGVPASLDAQKMNDAAGHSVLRLMDPRARVPEYEWMDRQSNVNGSVFVLPDRTWVGAIGDARTRARQAYATPFGRPAPKVDADALATVRFETASFLQNPRYARSPVLGPLTRKLRAVTLALKPGKGGVVATLQYETEDASAWAEMHVKRVIEELTSGTPARGAPSLEWLKTAKVGHENNNVVVQVAVPARLLEDLPNASAGDLML
jgi:hypothetical protein